MRGPITYRSVASLAIEILHLPDNSEEVYFMRRTEDAIRDIDCIETYIKDVCCFDVDNNGRVCLPPGFVKPVAIRYIPRPETSVNLNNPPWALNPGYDLGAGFLYYADVPLLGRSGCNMNGYAGGSRTYQINGDTLVLGGCQGGKIEMCYTGYAVEENGELSITKEMMQAAAYFLCKEYARAKGYSENIIRGYHNDYVAKVNYIRAHRQLIKMMEMKPQISVMMNSWLTRPHNAVT